MQYSREQVDIITAPMDRHLKVVAPPGSGKSAVCCARIKYLIDNNVRPNTILATMFNKPVAVEFRQILYSLGLTDANMPIVRHYHALGRKICITLMKQGMLPEMEFCMSQKKLNDLAVLALIDATEHVNTKALNPRDPAVIEDFLGYLDFCKSQIIKPSEVFHKMGLEEKYNPFIRGYLAFETIRKREKLRFFNDMILDPAIALSTNHATKYIFAGKIRHLIVDEYQDINPITNLLIEGLAGDWANVSVVGDDDQAINSWRGSEPEFLIDRFERSFPNPLCIELTRTYRYGNSIALAANNTIVKNTVRVDKLCISAEMTPNTVITIGNYKKGLETPYADPEQLAIVDGIKAHLHTGKLGDIAILLRVYSLSPHIELALLKNNIPYRLDGKLPVTSGQQFSVFKDLLSLTTHRIKTTDELRKMLKSVLLYPHPGIKADSLCVLLDAWVNDLSITEDKILDCLGTTHRFVAQKVVAKVIAIQNAMNSKGNAGEQLYNYVSELDLFTLISKSYSDSEKANEHYNIVSAVLTMVGASGLNAEAQLGAFNDIAQKNGDASEAVTIMSMHRSKGLAWPYVIVPGLCETIIPNVRSGRKTDFEAERRLYFVGITRAKDKLLLVTPHDSLFEDAMKRGNAFIPAGHQVLPTHTSRYVYESDIASAMAVADAITSNTRKTLASSSSAKTINKYLAKINSEIRVKEHE